MSWHEIHIWDLIYHFEVHIYFGIFLGLQRPKLVSTRMLRRFSKKYQRPHRAQNGIMNRVIKNGTKLKLTKVIHIIGISKLMVRIYEIVCANILKDFKIWYKLNFTSF